MARFSSLVLDLDGDCDNVESMLLCDTDVLNLRIKLEETVDKFGEIT